jgi:hypothetical protein
MSEKIDVQSIETVAAGGVVLLMARLDGFFNSMYIMGRMDTLTTIRGVDVKDSKKCTTKSRLKHLHFYLCCTTAMQLD